MRLTRYHFAHEIAEKCESVVERWANVLRTGRLEANRGVDTAGFAVDIRRDKIICNVLGLSIRNNNMTQVLRKYSM